MCGWCGDSCEIAEECSNTFITEGENCPAPVIISISPLSGELIYYASMELYFASFLKTHTSFSAHSCLYIDATELNISCN